MDNLFLIGQIVLGIYFAKAGIEHFMGAKNMAGYAASKGLPAPLPMVYLSGLMLLLGGLGILFQMYLSISYAMVIIFLVVAAFTIHAFWKAKDPQSKMADKIQFEKNLGLAAALLMLMSLSM